MKVPMYQEITNVIVELIKHRFHKIPLIKDFFRNVILKNFDDLHKHMHLSETILMDLVQTFLQIDNFSSFKDYHYNSLESLLWHVIKPTNADVYYPKTMELMQAILLNLNDALKTFEYMPAVYRIWCILARIAKKYIEDSQNINEGTVLEHNFQTIESILAFPFKNIFITDIAKIKIMADTWKELYTQFDYQAELIVSVKPNEIFTKTTNMILTSFKKDARCCEFAIICVDGLLNMANYENISNDDQISPIVVLIKDLVLRNLDEKSFTTEKILKIMSSFLLRIFSHSTEKTAACLMKFQTPVKYMLTKTDDSNLEAEISNTWNTIVGIFKKLQKSLNYDLLNCYRSTIVAAMLHLNKDISSSAFSILDLKDTVDEKTKLILEDIIGELENTSVKANYDFSNYMLKSAKKKNTPVKPVGSFLNRKAMSPSNSTTILQNGKENVKNKVLNFEPESQDFVVIQSDVKLDVNRLTEHQKEMLKKRRDDIPAMYNDLTVSNSQDTQEIQQWFDARSDKLSPKQIHEPSNNNDLIKTPKSTFKDLSQVLSKDQHDYMDKSVIPSSVPAAGSPPANKRLYNGPTTLANGKDKAAVDEVIEVIVVGNSTSSSRPDDNVVGSGGAAPPSSGRRAASSSPQAPGAAKKLNFESREDFPEEEKEEEEEEEEPPGRERPDKEVSPSVIEGAKNRRKQNASSEEAAADAPAPPVVEQNDKLMRLKRRSLQPQDGVPLRKFNSTEQLTNRRGRKRRNSDTNSEGVLDIEREKRPRRDAVATDSENSQENDGKKISKRQMTEMSRLKIDMRFEPLPRRRSVNKAPETPGTDKKLTSKNEKSKEDKKSTFLKDDKSKETKLEMNQSQQSGSSIKRRSMKLNISPISEKKETAPKKQSPTENVETLVRSTARKSLPSIKSTETIVSYKKKSATSVPQEAQEEIDIEDVSTPLDSVEKVKLSPPQTPKSPVKALAKSPVKSPVKSPPKSPVKSPVKSQENHSLDENEETPDSEVKSSQDSDVDIVESSQVPSFNSKMDKVECFIKIKKMEVIAQPLKTIEETQEKDDKINDSTPMDTEDASLSIIPATVEIEKPVAVQQEIKKVENNTGKAAMPLSQTLSPKSSTPRFLKNRAFPIRNRAAQMLGLVTQGSISISQLSNLESLKPDNLTEDVSIIPLSRKEKLSKEPERISSPVSSNRQEKMFNNMNNASIRVDRCSSPSITMFCNLRNDGEKISPKLDKLEKEVEVVERENGEVESPCGRPRKELPMLEWSNANPPSLTASPSASILKRNPDADSDTPNRKKRVSFADPPVSREMGYEIMTENSSPPRLEKLPSIRSPISRKDSRRHSKLRLIQIDSEKIEKENDLLPSNNIEEKTNEMTSIVSLNPKIKLATVLTEIPLEESKAQPPESDMFISSSVSTSHENNMPKCSSQNDSIKLDSINISNIAKTDCHHNSLEDTVDVDNLSLDSLSSMSADRPMTSSQQSGEPGDTLPVTDSVFSTNALSQETQSNVARLIEPEKLDCMMPVFPSLISCSDGIDAVCPDLVDPLFTMNLNRHLMLKSIRSVGDLAQLTERDVNRLPIKSPKLECVKKALTRHADKLSVKTPDRRTTAASSIPSSSTPLGNKRREKHRGEADSFEELSKMGSGSSELGDINVSAVYECRRPSKRLSTDSSIQTSPMKRSKREDEKTCRELMDQCDDEFLFETFMNRFDAEKILQGYKEKMNEKSDKELKKETLHLLGLSVEDDSDASFKASTKTAGLHKVLQQLPKIFDSDKEFYDAVLKTYKKKLKITDILKAYKSNEVEDAIVTEMDSSKLLHILNKRINIDEENGGSIRDSSELSDLLRHLPSSSIVKQVKERDELKTPDMFSIIAENFDVIELSDMCNEAVKSGIRKKYLKK